MGYDLSYVDYQNAGVVRTVSPQAPLPVSLVTPPANWNSLPTSGYDTDGASGAGSAREVDIAELRVYNDGTGNSERWRNNVAGSLLASAARTTSQTGADQTNYNHEAVDIVVDMSNVAAAPSITITIEGKDPVSGNYYPLLVGAAITTVSTNVYRIGPGLTAAANAVANYRLPRTWRIRITANNANSGTYSVGYSAGVC